MPLAPASQTLFAFKWSGPECGFQGQLSCSRLSQTFKNLSTIFDEALNGGLGEYRQAHLQITLLQCIDDLLIAAPDEDTCYLATDALLRELDWMGY